MQNVKNILDLVLHNTIDKEDWKINLVKNWATIIGSLHEKISLQKINANNLVLGVYDSSWMQELYLLSKVIIKKINSQLDKPRIETLRFTCIEKKIKTPSKIKVNRPLKKFELKPKELQALQKIQDPELSHALQGFLQKCQQ